MHILSPPLQKFIPLSNNSLPPIPLSLPSKGRESFLWPLEAATWRDFVPQDPLLNR